MAGGHDFSPLFYTPGVAPGRVQVGRLLSEYKKDVEKLESPVKGKKNDWGKKHWTYKKLVLLSLQSFI